MKLTWKAFEAQVRKIAEFKWGVAAVAKTINGVNFDAVLDVNGEKLVLIEITENHTLDKIRADISKHNVVRIQKAAEGIVVQAFIVTKHEPTNSMRVSGEENRVNVMSHAEFQKMFLDYEKYSHIRSKTLFGSAVNPITGDPDSRKYTPVYYKIKSSGKEIYLSDIVRRLTQGHSIVLTGNYGTGKSRCIKEVFDSFNAKESNKLNYILGINLKENWGIKRGEEMIRRHFDDLSLSDLCSPALSLLTSGSLTLLLDGFDEIAAQTWSSDPSRLRQIRRSSLLGVKDIVSKSKGSVLISGREHYFNNDAEMLSAFGLHPTNTEIIECKDEFSDSEFSDYLSTIKHGFEYPDWLPKRPLICQIIAELSDDELSDLSIGTSNEAKFWHHLIQKIVEREERIHGILESNMIHSILKELANLTREKPDNLGPISLTEINEVFENVTGTPPVDESSVMLQRLPTLGRMSSQTTDRQFIESTFLDALRAEYLIDAIKAFDSNVYHEGWRNPLGSLGQLILAYFILENSNASTTLQFLKKAVAENNFVLVGDIVSSFAIASSEHNFDLEGMVVSNTHISTLDISSGNFDNVVIKDSEIDVLIIGCPKIETIFIENCCIYQVIGVSSKDALPEIISKNEFDKFESVDNTAGIRKSNLSTGHKILLSILQKVFFQRGTSRKIETLYRGFEAQKKDVDSVISLLVKENCIEKNSGGESFYIKPKRNKTGRMREIKEKLALSKDPIWDKVSIK